MIKGFNKLSFGLIGQVGKVVSDETVDIMKGYEFSCGVELRSKGFLFYGYPAAVTLEQHYPLRNYDSLWEETWWKEGKTYIKFLFDF